MHNCLECLGLSLAEYARYSPLLFHSLCFIYPVAAIRRWSPGAGVPWRRLLRRRVHRRPGVVQRFPGRRPHLSICMLFVLALLGHICFLVSVLRYCCFRWPFVYLELLYSSPRGPWLVLYSLCYFICRVVLWYHAVSLGSGSCAFACMITVHGPDPGASHLCMVVDAHL